MRTAKWAGDIKKLKTNKKTGPKIFSSVFFFWQMGEYSDKPLQRISHKCQRKEVMYQTLAQTGWVMEKKDSYL